MIFTETKTNAESGFVVSNTLMTNSNTLLTVLENVNDYYLLKRMKEKFH